MDTLIEMPEAQEQKPTAPTRPEIARVLRPVRNQIELLPRELDSTLPEDHPARAIWSFLCRLDLSAFYGSIKAVVSAPGHPATDPQVLLALWLMATVDGISSARKLDRLCEEHDAYRWILGGVPVNYHMLSDFRVGHQSALNELLTEILASMMSVGLVTLRHVAQDGMKVRASASKGSFRREARLEKLLEEAREQVERLAKASETPDPEVSRQQQAGRERAARDRQDRLEQALGNLPAVRAAKERKLKRGSQAEKAKVQEPRVSTTDPEARVMKMPDGGFLPAYNLQIASDVDGQVIVGVAVTMQGSDGGQAAPMVKQVVERTEVRPGAYLIDGGFTKHEDITAIELQGIEVYAPVRSRKEGASDEKVAEPGDDCGQAEAVAEQQVADTAEAHRKPYSIDDGLPNQEDIMQLERQGIAECVPVPAGGERSTDEKVAGCGGDGRQSAAMAEQETAMHADCQGNGECAPVLPEEEVSTVKSVIARRRKDTPEVIAWRTRMGTEEAKTIYKERASTAECVNARGRAYGLTQLVVRGTQKVLSVLLLVAITHNLLRWISLTS